MAQLDKQIRISTELAQKLFPLAVSICVLISLIIPGVYCYLEFNKMENEADLYSRQLADDVRKLASTAPTLWKYQATKYAEIIESFSPNKKILDIIVLDEQLKPINQFRRMETTQGFFSRFGIDGEPVQIIFNNKMIGEIRIRIAGESFLFTTFIVLIFCTVIGLSLSLLVYRVPIGVVTRLEQQLMDYHYTLEEQVAQRTTALQETTERAVQLAEARRRDQDALMEAKATLEQRVAERTQELQDQVSAKEQAMVKLAEAQNSLLEMSRAAGMAEVATGVLHNVGNVLNSVNVSCNLLVEQLMQSRTVKVAKLADLLKQHQGNLSEFLISDPSGRQVPGYLISLAPTLEEERQFLLKETHTLRDRIDHIKEIVSMQQSYGRVSGVLETITPEILMEDALKLNTGSLTHHGITVQRDYQSLPPMVTDRHQVLQILLNLINNARYACIQSTNEPKIITLQLLSHKEEGVLFQVIDNGVGIASDTLTRIFQHGFTTRKDGHGFGLHSGAIAAKELGGSLTVHSDGPSLGATFTLELPYRRGERTGANP